MSLFEQATRQKLRFTLDTMTVNVEDLWDLKLTGKNSLDNLAKNINKQLKEAGEESFVVEKSSADTELQLMFDVVKYIIDVRLAEVKAAQQKAKIAKQKQKLLQLKARKEDEALEGLSVEDIDAALAALDE